MTQYPEKNRAKLLEQEVIGVLKTIFEHHFVHRLEDAIHLEIAIITLASIRQLSRTKKGKDQLIGLEGKIANRPKLLTSYAQLQDSLCALCMRFLPQIPFPLPQDQLFPLRFSLPSGSEGNSTPLRRPSTSTSGRRLKKSSTSPQKKTPNTKLISGRSSLQLDDAFASSDDGGDEEDDSFLYFNNSDQMDDTDGHANFSDEDLDEDGENFYQSADRKSAVKLDGLSSAFNVANYSRQKLGELKGNYHHLFVEFEQGALGIGNQSPKMRKTHASTSSSSNHKDLVQKYANTTVSVGKFVKIAYPDLLSPEELDRASSASQPFLQSTESMRDMLMQEIPKSRLQSSFERRVVFDLDTLIKTQSCSSAAPLVNSDLEKIGKLDSTVDHLKFESRFESGNLRQAIQVSDNHYELILSPDINQHSAHFQWFYFQVSNNKANVPYTFEVINCLKSTSMMSRGMQPLMFSVSEPKQGWMRTASSVCYYRNLYSNEEESGPASDKEQTPTENRASPVKQFVSKDDSHVCGVVVDTKSFFSARFTISFPHQADICYIAYHFPYTYSYLRASLESFVSRCSSTSNIYVRSSRLTQTLAGNDVPIVTLTAHGSAQELDYARHSAISKLRLWRDQWQSPVFTGWSGLEPNVGQTFPSAPSNPFHTKGLIQYMADVLDKPPWVFVDLHGHSRRPNIFMYGNNPEESWRPSDHSMEHKFTFLGLPDTLEKIAPGFSLRDCRFSISKSKEFSARIAVWRQFGVERAYTMEATYCGYDLGPMAGQQIRVKDLKEMGEQLCQAILQLKNSPEGMDMSRLQHLKHMQGQSPNSAATKNKTARKSGVGTMEFERPLAGLRILPKARKSLSFSKP
uniref:Cytosolic carboxypeptidase N-terminal domain-containing protein n=1 Tax=Ditylenchus dipsaci TaxID=166011 RepID=A0A915EKJ0_9BILA